MIPTLPPVNVFLHWQITEQGLVSFYQIGLFLCYLADCCKDLQAVCVSVCLCTCMCLFVCVCTHMHVFVYVHIQCACALCTSVSRPEVNFKFHPPGSIHFVCLGQSFTETWES